MMVAWQVSHGSPLMLSTVSPTGQTLGQASIPRHQSALEGRRVHPLNMRGSSYGKSSSIAAQENVLGTVYGLESKASTRDVGNHEIHDRGLQQPADSKYWQCMEMLAPQTPRTTGSTPYDDAL